MDIELTGDGATWGVTVTPPHTTEATGEGTTVVVGGNEAPDAVTPPTTGGVTAGTTGLTLSEFEAERISSKKLGRPGVSSDVSGVGFSVVILKC